MAEKLSTSCPRDTEITMVFGLTRKIQIESAMRMTAALVSQPTEEKPGRL
jgi:hypothetical protein